MNDNSKVIAGVLAGLVAGAAIGLLLAPEKGADLRHKISDGVDSASGGIKDTLGSLKSKFETSLEHFEKDLKKVVNEQLQHFKEQASTIRDAKEDLVKKANSFDEHIAN